MIPTKTTSLFETEFLSLFSSPFGTHKNKTQQRETDERPTRFIICKRLPVEEDYSRKELQAIKQASKQHNTEHSGR